MYLTVIAIPRTNPSKNGLPWYATNIWWSSYDVKGGDPHNVANATIAILKKKSRSYAKIASACRYFARVARLKVILSSLCTGLRYVILAISHRQYPHRRVAMEWQVLR